MIAKEVKDIIKHIHTIKLREYIMTCVRNTEQDYILTIITTRIMVHFSTRNGSA